MKDFAIFNYVFAVICLIAVVVLFITHIPILAWFTLLAAIAFGISGFLAQKLAKEDIK